MKFSDVGKVITIIDKIAKLNNTIFDEIDVDTKDQMLMTVTGVLDTL